MLTEPEVATDTKNLPVAGVVVGKVNSVSLPTLTVELDTSCVSLPELKDPLPSSRQSATELKSPEATLPETWVNCTFVLVNVSPASTVS